ncbi:nuclear polyadenylated RNA-binding protein 3-like [Panicum hallii]|uniref:nuclear polyadenylated RNA-binding protein 3-like n=1 Tax=Panicum hallii TaxID=206008 RepID=UPI000DF4D0B7|nr:nuclear polyadenylated RNA-binding protein 3-like [Panicum hallii]
MVIDPRGTLRQGLAGEATADVQPAKENDDAGDDNDSSGDEDEEEEEIEKENGHPSADGDEKDNELENSADSTEKTLCRLSWSTHYRKTANFRRPE